MRELIVCDEYMKRQWLLLLLFAADFLMQRKVLFIIKHFDSDILILILEGTLLALWASKDSLLPRERISSLQ